MHASIILKKFEVKGKQRGNCSAGKETTYPWMPRKATSWILKKKVWQILHETVCHTLSLVSLLDQQLQLFQLFHLWHVFPGFSLTAFFSSSQKEASFRSALLLKGFFTVFHPPSILLILPIEITNSINTVYISIQQFSGYCQEISSSRRTFRLAGVTGFVLTCPLRAGTS